MIDIFPGYIHQKFDAFDADIKSVLSHFKPPNSEGGLNWYIQNYIEALQSDSQTGSDRRTLEAKQTLQQEWIRNTYDAAMHQQDMIHNTV